MTETCNHTTAMTGDAPDLAQIAALDFVPADPAMQTVPSAEDWDRLYTALATAAAVLSKPKSELMEALVEGDADGLLASMAATMKAAGESFGALQATCATAEARIFIAAAAVAQA